MQIILDELETFVAQVYTRRDYERFEMAATNNKQLLDRFRRQWPTKIKQIKRDIANA